MENNFEKILDDMILEKKRKGITFNELKLATGISQPALVRMMNHAQRGTARVGNVIEVLNYINNKKVEVK